MSKVLLTTLHASSSNRNLCKGDICRPPPASPLAAQAQPWPSHWLPLAHFPKLLSVQGLPWPAPTRQRKPVNTMILS